jgi:hypothetical protein
VVRPSRPVAAPALGCGLLAVVLAILGMITTLRGADWSLTALPRVDSQTRLGAIARTFDPGFHTIHPGAYDGQFYWGIAVDPLAIGHVHQAFDKASYRYGHPLYGWLGWLFSAGRPRAVPAALAAVGLVSMFAAAAAAAALGVGRGRAGWEGLFVALNLGLISSIAQDLAEPLAAALLLGALLAYVRERRVAAWLCFALLPLSKEPLLLVLVGVVVWELVQRHLRVAAMFAAAAIPATLWWVYARVHLGAWFTSGSSALGEPLVGWSRTLFGADGRQGETRGVAVAILVSLIVLFLLGVVRALRKRGPVEFAFLGLAAIAACLAPNSTAAFSTALRNTAFLFLLVPFVVVSPQLLPKQGRGAPARRAVAIVDDGVHR